MECEKIISRKSFKRLFSVKFFDYSSILFLAYVLYSINDSELPDYDSYKVIYYLDEYTGIAYETFQRIVLFLRGVGLDYIEFRELIIFLGLIFSYIILLIKRKNYSNNNGGTGILINHSYFFIILISVFIFEYYVIRLRAGLSIFFLAISFYLFQYFGKYYFNKNLKWIFLLVFSLISASIHIDTFVSIILFVFPAALWSRYIKTGSQSNEYIYFLSCLIAWLCVFNLGVTSYVEARGVELVSTLNPVRFTMISIIPLMMLLFFIRLNLHPKNIYIRQKSYSHLYVLNYAASATALLSYYYFSYSVSVAGEAIVRIMTLSSFGAIMSLAITGICRMNLIPLYIVVINSLFFLMTIYG
jgi:hypothetical protein